MNTHHDQPLLVKINDCNCFRFGHSAVLHNGTLVIYGGFNGQTKGDIILFHPGHCAHVKEEDECIASYHGLKCVWNRKKDVCEVWGQTGKKNSASLCSPHTRNNTGVCRSGVSVVNMKFRNNTWKSNLHVPIAGLKVVATLAWRPPWAASGAATAATQAQSAPR